MYLCVFLSRRRRLVVSGAFRSAALALSVNYICVAPATGDDAPVAAAAALDDSLCSGVVVAVPAAPAVSALVGRAPEASPWFVRRRGVIIDVPEGAVAGSRAIVSLPDDGSARHATVTIAFPPGLSTGQELTVALEV